MRRETRDSSSTENVCPSTERGVDVRSMLHFAGAAPGRPGKANSYSGILDLLTVSLALPLSSDLVENEEKDLVGKARCFGFR